MMNEGMDASSKDQNPDRGYGSQSDGPVPMMKRFKVLLRKTILFSNRYSLFLRLNRFPYNLAVSMLRHLLGRFPEVAALYARNSFALGHWVPGASDIDLTLVIKSDLPSEQEYRFCKQFEKKYSNLCRFFPMLGEVELLNEAHLHARTRYDTTYFVPNQWKLLFGSGLLKSPQVEEVAQAQFYRINRAVATYYHMFVPCMTRLCREGRRPDLTMTRIALKILRLLGDDMSTKLHSRIEASDTFELFYITLDRLSNRVRSYLNAQNHGEAALDFERLFNGAVYNTVNQKQVSTNELNTDHLQSVVGIVALNVSPHRTYVLLRLDQDPKIWRQSISSVLSAYKNPLFTDEYVFFYYLSIVNSLEYMLLMQERNLFVGHDPFPLRMQPAQKTFRPSVCYYAADMFSNLYSESLWNAPQKEFQDLLFGWFLRTLFYLEKDFIEFEYHKLEDYFRMHHPEYERAVGPLSAALDPTARFTLLRLVLNDLSIQMTATDS